MKTLGVYNIKGGVGKTATSVNLGHLAAGSGLRTLIWDLDPQGASTFYFRVKPKVKKSTKVLHGKRDLDGVVKATDYEGLDLLPADFTYRNMDLLLNEAKKPTMQLTRLLRPLSNDYDLVIFDCPPSISLVSENVFRAADALLVPTIPTILSQRTLSQLLGFIKDSRVDTRVLSFYSMVDRRKTMHREIIHSPPDPRCTVLKSMIPYASVIERMGTERRPVMEYAPSSAAGKSYQQLWNEVAEQMGGLVNPS